MSNLEEIDVDPTPLEQDHLRATFKENVLEWLHDPEGENRTTALAAALFSQFCWSLEDYKQHELFQLIQNWAKNGTQGYDQMDANDLAAEAAEVLLSGEIEGDFAGFETWVFANS